MTPNKHIVDNQFDRFSQKPELDRSLAESIFRSLAADPFRLQLIDGSQPKLRLRAGILLATALILGRRWKAEIAEKRVGLVFPPTAGAYIANVALVLAGKVPVNLNVTAGRDALEKSMERAGVRTVITATSLKERFAQFPWPKELLLLDECMAVLPKARILACFMRILMTPISLLLRQYEIPREGGNLEAGLIFSSGSTGRPKGIILSHRNILGNCLQIEESGILSGKTTIMANLPIFHSFGFTVTMWFALLKGARVVTYPSPLDPRPVADLIERESVQVLIGAPTFFRPYFKWVDPHKLRSLEYVIAGAEKTPDGFADRWESIFGSIYLEGYGLTETSPVVACNLPSSRALDGSRRGAVGRLFPGMQARILEPTSGEILPPDEKGILCLRGANVFEGYLGDEKATKASLKEGWLITGDLGCFDEDGFLYVGGRLSRFSKIGGEMVPHGTVEQKIIEHFGYEDSDAPVLAVTGVTHETRGESLILVTTVDFCPQELRKAMSNAGLPNLWIPKIHKRVDKIPCLGTGKLDLQGLRRVVEEL